MVRTIKGKIRIMVVEKIKIGTKTPEGPRSTSQYLRLRQTKCVTVTSDTGIKLGTVCSPRHALSRIAVLPGIEGPASLTKKKKRLIMTTSFLQLDQSVCQKYRKLS